MNAEEIEKLNHLIEHQQQQIEMLSNPDWVRSLLLRFSQLTQTRQMLFLELMREMKEGKNE